MKKNIKAEDIRLDSKMNDFDILEPGTRLLKDLLAPASIEMPSEDYLKLGDKYLRNFILQGYPSRVQMGWLDSLYNYDGDMDTVIYIVPADDRRAQDELTKKIAEYESQLAVERSKGSIQHITDLSSKVNKLYAEREKLEQNIESLYHIAITSNLITDSLEDLNKKTQILDNTLKGKRMNFIPTYLRMDDGFKSALPLAKNFLKDKLRNMNTGGLIACFPFYNSEINHEDGIFIGLNMTTGTPIFLDLFDLTKLNNTNVSVFGTSGSGKTFFVSLLTMRSALKNIRTTIIDPEGEYKPLTAALGGANIVLAPDSQHMVNPFDIEEEEILSDKGVPTGIKEVKVKDKVSDLLNLISVMCGANGISAEERSLVSMVLQKLYKDFGITTDPNSLYIEGSEFDSRTGMLHQSGKKKTMPTFSDFHELLARASLTEKGRILQPLVNTLLMFKKGGTYDLFDTQSTVDSSLFKNAPIVNFDVSRLEDGVLRPIGMYVALSWAWEKFGKKNPHIKKRIICDEAWMLVKKTMPGAEYTSRFLETCARRIRKRNGGLLVASQNFKEFADSPEGMAVLDNTAVKIFLKQSATDIDALQDKFKLSDGEKGYLLSCDKGEMLIKTDLESSVAYAMPFEFERELIESAKRQLG